MSGLMVKTPLAGNSISLFPVDRAVLLSLVKPSAEMGSMV